MEETPAYWNNLSLENIRYIDPIDEIDKEEAWLPVVGYEGLYEVSCLGRVKNIKSKRLVKQFYHEKGYLVLSLRAKGENKTKQVHRIVGFAFHPNPDNKPQINHDYGIKDYNVSWNLEWNTNGENGRHARRTGLCKQIAETASSATLANKQVLDIFKSELSQSELCRLYNTNDVIISNIKTGRKWSSITGKKYVKKKLSEEIVLKIFNSNLKRKDIAKENGVSKCVVDDIKTGKRWSWLTGKKKDSNG